MDDLSDIRTIQPHSMCHSGNNKSQGVLVRGEGSVNICDFTSSSTQLVNISTSLSSLTVVEFGGSVKPPFNPDLKNQ